MIPRIIHQFWDGGPLPDGMRRLSRDPGTVEVIHPQRLRDRPGVTNGALVVLEVFDAPIGGDHGAPGPA